MHRAFDDGADRPTMLAEPVILRQVVFVSSFFSEIHAYALNNDMLSDPSGSLVLD